MKRDRGLAIIIGYKLIKGGAWLVLALVLLIYMQAGLADRMRGLAEHLRHHARAWSIELAKVVVNAASRRWLWTIIVALLADGVASLFEAWALMRGHWWGPWLVVCTTATLLPFEFVALVRHPHAVRGVILVLNAAIVVYLARKAILERSPRGEGHFVDAEAVAVTERTHRP